MEHFGAGSTASAISWWRTRTGIAVKGFALVVAFSVLWDRWGDVLGFLPYGILLLCPLMHLFAHHSHGHGDTAPDVPRSHTV